MAALMIPASWQIPDQIRRRLGTTVGRQRAMFHEGHLLLVLHAPPKPDEPVREGRFFWRDASGHWMSKDLGSGIQALTRHIEQYEEVVARLDLGEERAATSDQHFRVLEHLAPIVRASRHLYQVLQDARKRCPDDADLINMRDRTYALERNAELLYEETKNALDYTVLQRAEEQAASSRHMEVTAHRLNMLVAFFFPIATLTAIFGVNLQHGLERAFPPYLFLGTIGVGLLLGLLLSAMVSRGHRRR